MATTRLPNDITKTMGFVQIRYDRLAPEPSQGLDCMFGPDTLLEFDASIQGWDTCWDPFGGFGGGGAGGGGCGSFGFDPFDPFGFDPLSCNSFFSETRQHCIRRHVINCNLVFAGCLAGAGIIGIGFFVGCSLDTLIAGAPACEVLGDVIAVLGAGGCVLNGASCLNAIEDGCPAT